jgi:hypothetical protein
MNGNVEANAAADERDLRLRQRLELLHLRDARTLVVKHDGPGRFLAIPFLQHDPGPLFGPVSGIGIEDEPEMVGEVDGAISAQDCMPVDGGQELEEPEPVRRKDVRGPLRAEHPEPAVSNVGRRP